MVLSQPLLNDLKKQGEAWAMIRYPNDIAVTLFTSNPAQCDEQFGASNFVFQPFDRNLPPYIIKHVVRNRIEYAPKTPVTHDTAFAKASSQTSKNAYINLVNKAIHAIEHGDIDKIVTSRALTIQGNWDVLETYLAMISKYKNATCYLWWHPETSYWMGASPELLLKYDDNDIETVALAGTRIAGTKSNWGEKEKKEQQLVTHYIIETLDKEYLGIDTVRQGATETVQAGNLEHLSTIITAVAWSQGSYEEAAQALHPTPAVAGLPVDKSLQFLKQYENHDRKLYCGYFGYYHGHEDWMQFNVNLRCIQATDKECVVYVGGGITEDSVPEDEFLETENKAQTMLSILKSY